MQNNVAIQILTHMSNDKIINQIKKNKLLIKTLNTMNNVIMLKNVPLIICYASHTLVLVILLEQSRVVMQDGVCMGINQST